MRNWYMLLALCWLTACQIIYPADQIRLQSTTGMRGTPLPVHLIGLPADVQVSVTLADRGTAQCELGDTSQVLARSAGNCTLAVEYTGSDQRIYATAFTLTFMQSQAPLRIALISGEVGVPMSLAVVGGNGDGAVTYTLLSSALTTGDCTLDGAQLTALAPGRCTVMATKQSSGEFLTQTAAATVIEFTEGAASVAVVPQPTATAAAVAAVTTAIPTAAPIVWSVVETAGIVLQPLTINISGNVPPPAIAIVGGDGECVVDAVGQVLARRVGTCEVAVTVADLTQSVFVPFAAAPAPVLTIEPLSGARAGTTLRVVGSTGTGAMTYAVSDGTASGCAIAVDVLNAQTEGTCVVTANQAADDVYAAAASLPTEIMLLSDNQAPLQIVARDGVYGESIALQTTGGSGDGAITFAVQGGSANGCRISDAVLYADSAGGCEVVATKAASAAYAAITSPVQSLTFARAAQQALQIQPTSAVYGSIMNLVVNGGSGSGQVALSVQAGSADSCSLSGTQLSAKSAGTCVVSATKAGTANYLPQTNSATVTFTKAPQATLVVKSVKGKVGSPIMLSATGGSGSGAVSFVVTGGTASGCRIVGGNQLTVKTAGQCTVQATKAADQNYQETTSASAIMVFY